MPPCTKVHTLPEASDPTQVREHFSPCYILHHHVQISVVLRRKVQGVKDGSKILYPQDKMPLDRQGIVEIELGNNSEDWRERGRSHETEKTRERGEDTGGGRGG